MLKRSVLASLLIAFTGLSAPSWAATAEERAAANTATRQGLFKVVVSYFGPIVGMARDQIPYDPDVVRYNASRIAELANMVPDVFRHDTREYTVATEALDGIWDNTEDFNAKAQTLAERASALAEAAGEGKGPALKAFGAVGAACKACHDDYREQN